MPAGMSSTIDALDKSATEIRFGRVERLTRATDDAAATRGQVRAAGHASENGRTDEFHARDGSDQHLAVQGS